MKRQDLMSVKTLTRVAMMVALSIVLKSYFSPMIGTGIRVNTYGTPIVVVGMMFGPIYGGLAGLIVDTAYALIWGYPPFTYFTVSSVLWGVVPGIILFKRMNIKLPRIIVVIVLASLSELVFNTFGVLAFTSRETVIGLLPWRVLVFLVMIPIHTYIFDVVYSRVIKPELTLLNEE